MGHLTVACGAVHAPSLDPRYSGSAVTRAPTALANFMVKMSERAVNADEYSPSTLRYLVRFSRIRGVAGEGSVAVCQQPYSVSLQGHPTGQGNVAVQKWTTYPPTVVSNLVVALLPGRVPCDAACSRLSQQFVARPGVDLKVVGAFLAELNRTVMPHLHAIWQQDFDMLGGRRVERTARQRYFASNALDRYEGRSSLEPVFAPTLFQTGVFNPDAWYGHPPPPDAAQYRSREFAAAIAPFRDRSMLIVHYPCSATFDRKGNVEGAAMSIDAVAAIIDGAGEATALCQPPEVWDSSGSRDLHWYRSAVGTYREVPKAAARLNRVRVNPPVLPIETLIDPEGPAWVE